MKQFLFIFTLPKKKKILEIREPKKKKKKSYSSAFPNDQTDKYLILLLSLSLI